MLFQPHELAFVEAYFRFSAVNPFLTDAMRASFLQVMKTDPQVSEREAKLPLLEFPDRPGLAPLIRRAHALLDVVRERLISKSAADVSAHDLRQYRVLLLPVLYYPHRVGFESLIDRPPAREVERFFKEFSRQQRYYLPPGFAWDAFLKNPAHVFACYAQVRRAYLLICRYVQGGASAVQNLRAAIWHSIFSYDFNLYGDLLYDRMHDIPTLITGPSGTGKELVASAIGLSRYIPFDDRKFQFQEEFGEAFHAVNLSALPRDLIESEMFGHVAGAFTGANKDRAGLFEQCGLWHAVFLDEIGELETPIQVKLLRILQTREFQRVGETETRRFHGKVIAATNRDLSREIAEGTFREDLFYRLCADVIRTPSLREQLDEMPDELPRLVRVVAERQLGSRALPSHIDWLSELALDWIARSPLLGPGYGWPGNFRELEQCVRSVLVRGEYHPQLPVAHLPVTPLPNAATPLSDRAAASAEQQLAEDVRGARLTMDQLLERYCSLVVARTGSIAAAARHLKKHRATVLQRVKPELVRNFGEAGTTRIPPAEQP